MNNHYKTAKALVDLLENKFSVGPIKIGLDPILGLIPGAGDVITTALAVYIIWLAKQMGLPNEKLTRMVGNVLVDFVMGTIPLAGDVADFIYRANRRNWDIIEEHFKRGLRETAEEAEIVTGA